MLLIDDITFRYRGSQYSVLQGVSFEVQAGQSVGVLGPNGAGKTTFLGALVNSLDGHRGGRVLVNGRADFATREIGIATQGLPLYPTLTVAENIEHAARLILGRKQAKSALVDALEEYNLIPLADVPSRELSGGQQRLVHLATSFVHKPPIRLLDEPTASLDFQTRLRLIKLVEKWRTQGMALLVTSHYPEDIEDLCTDLVLLHGGRARAMTSLASFVSIGAKIIKYSTQRNGKDVEHVITFDGETVNEFVSALNSVSASHADEALTCLELASGTLRQILLRDPELRSHLGEEVQPAGKD
jgi:ABC-2 type transport system ATP-binding protein